VLRWSNTGNLQASALGDADAARDTATLRKHLRRPRPTPGFRGALRLHGCLCDADSAGLAINVVFHSEILVRLVSNARRLSSTRAMNATLIFNPTAGRGKPTEAGRIVRALSDYDIGSEIVLTRKAGDGTALARKAAEEGCELVIAAGGDGTVNDVVNGLAGTSTRLGILPLGTVNVLARELGIPLDPQQAIRTIAEGAVKRIDLGRANDRYFTIMAGFGFDAQVCANVFLPLKNIVGLPAYVLAGLGALAKYRATNITLEMPNGNYSGKAFQVVIANSSTYALDLKLTPRASPDDGLLDVCIFERPITNRMGFIRQVAEVLVNRHLHHKAVRRFRTPSVTVKSDPGVMVQLDGDAFETTPMEVSILPRALPVIVPAA